MDGSCHERLSEHSRIKCFNRGYINRLNRSIIGTGSKVLNCNIMFDCLFVLKIQILQLLVFLMLYILLHTHYLFPVLKALFQWFKQCKWSCSGFQSLCLTWTQVKFILIHSVSVSLQEKEQQGLMWRPADWFGLSMEGSGFADGGRGMSKRME